MKAWRRRAVIVFNIIPNVFLLHKNLYLCQIIIRIPFKDHSRSFEIDFARRQQHLISLFFYVFVKQVIRVMQRILFLFALSHDLFDLRERKVKAFENFGRKSSLTGGKNLKCIKKQLFLSHGVKTSERAKTPLAEFRIKAINGYTDS